MYLDPFVVAESKVNAPKNPMPVEPPSTIAQILGGLWDVASGIVKTPFQIVFDNDALTTQIAQTWITDTAASEQAGLPGIIGGLNCFNPFAMLYNGVVGEDLTTGAQLSARDRVSSAVGGAISLAPVAGAALRRGGAAENAPGKLTYNAASKTWTSPGGIVYGQGSAHGNRVMHVMDHTAANASKPVHSVFSAPRNQVIGLVDEAWAAEVVPARCRQTETECGLWTWGVRLALAGKRPSRLWFETEQPRSLPPSRNEALSILSAGRCLAR